MNRHKNLKFWTEEKMFIIDVHHLAKKHMNDIKNGLIFMIKGCSHSIPTKITEGVERNWKIGLSNFFSIIPNGLPAGLKTLLPLLM